MMKFITPNIQGLLDYLAATGLIVFPFILKLHQESIIAHYLSLFMGIALIAYSLFSDYKLGIKPWLSFKNHLMFDLVVSAIFLIVPFIVGFNIVATIYCLLMGVGVIVVVSLSQTVSRELHVSDFHESDE